MSLHVAPQDVELLRALPRLVLGAGYVDACLSYPGLPMDDAALRREVAALAPELQPLVRLFALGDPVAPELLEPALGAELVGALERLRVLVRAPSGDLHGAGLCLIPFHGHVALVPAPRDAPVAVFGDDTAALAARLSLPRGARALALCAGPGVFALHLARVADHVIALEEQPAALACAELNVVMNGLDDRVTLRQGFALDALEPGERFGHVSANPPLLPFPRELFDPAPAAPAAPGLGSPCERIVRALPALLGEAGVAQLVGADLGDAGGPRVAGVLSAHAGAHGLASSLMITCQAPLARGGRLLGSLARNTARAGILSAAEAERRMLDHLERTGCDRLYLFSITATLGRRAPGLVVSRPDRLGGGFWTR